MKQFCMQTCQEHLRSCQVEEVRSRQNKHTRCYLIASGCKTVINWTTSISTLVSILYDGYAQQIWNEHFPLQSQDTCGVLWRALSFGEMSCVCQDILAIVLSLLFLTSCFMPMMWACAFLLIFFHFPFRGGCGEQRMSTALLMSLLVCF